MQKQPTKWFFKKGLIRNFAEFTSKHVPESLFFDKAKLCRSAASFKTRLQRRCFLVNFAKFVGAPLLQSTARRLLLIIAVSIILVMKGELASQTVNNNTKHCVKSVQIWSFVWSAFSRIRTEYGEIKKRLQYSCFPVKSTKFLRTSFFIEQLQWLLLRFNSCFQRSPGQKPMRLSPIHTRFS